MTCVTQLSSASLPVLLVRAIHPFSHRPSGHRALSSDGRWRESSPGRISRPCRCLGVARVSLHASGHAGFISVSLLFLFSFSFCHWLTWRLLLSHRGSTSRKLRRLLRQSLWSVLVTGCIQSPTPTQSKLREPTFSEAKTYTKCPEPTASSWPVPTSWFLAGASFPPNPAFPGTSKLFVL